MLFEENLSFLLLKIPITLVNSIVIMVSATDFKMIPRKAVKMSITALAGFSVYTVLSSLLIIKYFDYHHFMRLFSMTISCPEIVLLSGISDTSSARLAFIRTSHIVHFVHCRQGAAAMSHYHVSTVSREIPRNGHSRRGYSAVAAEKKYRQRRGKCKRPKLLSNVELHTIAKRLFLDIQWSPEQTAAVFRSVP